MLILSRRTYKINLSSVYRRYQARHQREIFNKHEIGCGSLSCQMIAILNEVSEWAPSEATHFARRASY